jgi:hypothetical protein
VAEAAAHFAGGDIALGAAALEKLAFATVDEMTLEATDGFLANLRTGKKIVATCNVSRQPAADEIVIVYGNFPHGFDNVVVNNPIRRHVSGFGEFTYDAVEFDPRWERVDQIYVINVAHRKDRYDSVMRELAAARAPLQRLTRIPADTRQVVRSKALNGAIGCLNSHIAALRDAKQRGFAHILILEDDFCFTSDLETHLDHLDRFLRGSYGYLICLLAASKYGRIEPLDDLVSRSIQPCTNAAAYLVSRAGVGRLLEVNEAALAALIETGDAGTYAADRAWSVLQGGDNFLVFRRKFGFQAAGYSDIEHRITRYLD